MAVTKQFRYTIWFLISVMMISSAFALNTHVNISISETVHQNVSYAENFDLVENRTYALIEGVIVVTNPGAETIYDINIRLDNISSLDSNFVYASGRNGSQSVFPSSNWTAQNLTGTINSSAYADLGMDLDEDGTNDTVSTNDTHIIFNLSSEWDVHAFAYYNSSTTGLNISATPTLLDMNFNINSYRRDNDHNNNTLFANVVINGTITNSPGVLNTTNGDVQILVNNTARAYAILHIPELRSSQSTTFNYNISSTLVTPPLDINSTYTNAEFQTKVLAGQRFNVLLHASNIATVGALELVNITLNAEDVNVSNATSSEIFNFTLTNLSNDTSISGDYLNVVDDNVSNRTWYWIVNNGTIAIGQTYNISFQITAPETVASSGTHLALTQILSYQINTTASTLAVGEVRARAAIIFNTTKQIIGPQDNNSNRNVTWRSIPNIGTSENITYTLETVSLWVTEVLDPNQNVSGLYTTYNPAALLNITTSWTGAPWLFNFTDGSTSSAPPPIVWIKPYWIITNTANQILNSSVTVNGTDLYMNYIYVVNGYWLEVQKQVLDTGDDEFDIRIVVRNRGNGYTPQNLTVTIYDFIPAEFTAWNFSPSSDNASNVTGEFAGVAYQWDVGLRTNLSTSFAPRGDANGLDYFYINYSVNGSGDFRVSDLYIVGLDPRLVDGARSFEGVSVLAGIATTNREVVYALIVFFLIAINIANFMMTSKINSKLDKK